MDFVFAADVDTAKTDKTSFPDFPGENPPQAEMLKWLDAWHDDLVTSGFSAHLRGELPFEDLIEQAHHTGVVIGKQKAFLWRRF